jgi:hypothetical protein
MEGNAADEDRLTALLATVSRQQHSLANDYTAFAQGCGRFDEVALRFAEEIESTRVQLKLYTTPIAGAGGVSSS